MNDFAFKNPDFDADDTINGSGSFLPPTGSEVITNYVTASNEPIPLNNLNLETYKRLYHNLPYLLKTKGTIPGLRALINCFGIPDTILRISEFGGRDKDTSTYDYFDQQFNYAAVASASSNISTPWLLNTAWSASINEFKASSVQFRFKTSDFDTGSNYQMWGLSTSILQFNSSSSLVLKYSGSGLTTGSYSGSIGGGLWWTGSQYIATQSFTQKSSKDIESISIDSSYDVKH